MKDSSSIKAKCEQLEAQSKLTQTASYLKMLKKLEKIGPNAHIQLNLYHSTKQQLASTALAQQLCFSNNSTLGLLNMNTHYGSDQLSQQLAMARVNEEVFRDMATAKELSTSE